MHYITNQGLQNKNFVAYVPSAEQVANCLTKALTYTQFNKHGVTLSSISLKGELDTRPLDLLIFMHPILPINIVNYCN